MYIFYCNRTGKETTLNFIGRSTVSSPHGTILAQLGDGTESVIVNCTLKDLKQAQESHPFLVDLRAELFK